MTDKKTDPPAKKKSAGAAKKKPAGAAKNNPVGAAKKKPAGPANKRPVGSKKGTPVKGPFGFYWAYLAIGGMLIAMLMLNTDGGGKEITWLEFSNKIESGDVERVQHDGHRVQVFLTQDAKDDLLDGKDDKELMSWVKGADHWLNLPPGDEYLTDLKRLEKEHNVAVKFEPVNEWGQQIVTWIIFLVILVTVWTLLMKRMGGGAGGGGGQLFNIGKSKATLFDKEHGTNVNFDDVAGLEGAKEELEEIVDFLKHPKRYTELGAKIPKGALLVGPPGTGKTLMAKAVAGEAQVPFFSLSGSDFVEMFVGVGASRVRDLFKQAKEKSPCIVFIDEIDAVGRARGKNASMGSNDERENTLNQLLTEMDGFGTNSGVIILAATNRADILDKALMRAGRFDRQIYVDMPDLTERKEIFKVHLKPLVSDGTIDVEFLAKQTPGFSGADIANICNEAALIAARRKGEKVTKQDFLDAVDRVVGGLEKRSKLITADEKRTIAYHEAGHALVSWMLKYASPLVKVTIVPRGQSLGAAWYLPEERHITTTEQIFHEMCATMGGRAAEQEIFGEISTGALSDLEKVTKQAYAMVTVYGLNDKIGNRSFYDAQNNSMFIKPYSEATATIIDEETSKLIEKAYARAREILSEHLNPLKMIADRLLEKEVLFKEDLEDILGPRPYGDKPDMNTLLAEPEAPTEPEAPEA